nr:hypothetical protein [uncultured Cellulosilyticum sp.]
MSTVKFSIIIDAEKKKVLETMAKQNYRSISGEINVAIDLYIQQMTTGMMFTQSPAIQTVAQQESEVNEITINSFEDIEVDEF